MVESDAKIAAVIVTHNSEQVLPACLTALGRQIKPPNRIVIIDSGSSDPGYLLPYQSDPRINILFRDNIGFSRANNLGAAQVSGDCDFVLFLNPDTFVDEHFFFRALAIMEEFPDAGVLTGKMRSFDPTTGQATGGLDSTGVLRKWYGRWYDRGHGEEDRGQYEVVQYVPAVCGALMFCRSALLRGQVVGSEFFDPDFFMYKEDVELGLRFGKKGVKFLYHPQLKAFHCRGWDKNRRKVPYSSRLLSARNEVLLYRKHPSPYMIWALVKYLLVRLFHL